MRPCLARFSRVSSARRTVTLSPSVLTVIPAGTGLLSSPFGPFTLTEPAFCASETPLGTGSTFRPMRLISPDLAEELAAQTGLAGGPVGHETLRRREDRDPQTGADLGDGSMPDVHPLAGTRPAPEPRDRVGARGRVGPAQP